ncbi:hypothetical protein [Halocalculus aciditolerans]|uniref:Uncharacterized protein n=1 Tax=Halocalculus aciditolerans TaxID=1383812 RepID=A0A830FMD2_9EURY|nr:hypothetical protein [Halocalculus aciditolerans]GGL60552.1 hypothetical protein GCM10009039_18530 [Halocalculus aciditolerans]
MERGDDLNEERLRILGRYLADLSLVETVQYFPSEKEDRVVAAFDHRYYPDVVDASRLELRLRLNGDFNVQYFEEWAGEQWSCRWDRHPNTHNTRDHFHVPPTPSEAAAVDASYPPDPTAVLRCVLETVERRINDLWTATTDPVFPSEYAFAGEYGASYLDGDHGSS